LLPLTEGHGFAKELSHEGLIRSEDWKKSVRGFPFFPLLRPYPYTLPGQKLIGFTEKIVICQDSEK